MIFCLDGAKNEKNWINRIFKFHSTGIKVQQPEIVIVGGQSDGKSSLVEAIVGFKFNFIAVGTPFKNNSASRVLILSKRWEREYPSYCN